MSVISSYLQPLARVATALNGRGLAHAPRERAMQPRAIEAIEACAASDTSAGVESGGRA